MNRATGWVLGLALLAAGSAAADAGSSFQKGLSPEARRELIDAGVTKYVGRYAPAASADVGEGWTRHAYDPGADDGPICIAGTDYSVYTKVQDPRKLLIMLQGGGACWQDFYNCNIRAEDQAPPPPPVGIWGPGFDTGMGVIPNPIADWSIVYLPYCDGSVFTGDNAVPDPAFQTFIEEQLGLPPGFGPPVRFHRGLRNVTAGVDLAREMFPDARRILVAGSSAGGVGASAFAPFLARFAFGNGRELRVFNDAGPVAINTLDVPAILARAADWQFAQFYPESCTDCSAMGQATAIIDWRLENDAAIHEAFYSTDADFTNRFFLKVPTQPLYRELLLAEHGALHAAYPDRYKRFIRSGDGSHTALQTPLLYFGAANGVPLFEWLADFVRPDWWHRVHGNVGDRPPWNADKASAWIDLVEDFVPVPSPGS